MEKHQAKLAAIVVFLGGFFGAISSSDAGGFLNTLQSASSAGTAGAGATAFGDDAATVWYNPAGMMLSVRPEALISGGLIFPSTSFENHGSTDAVGLPVAGNSLTNPTASLLPSIFGLLPINDQLHVGIGVFAPFGQMSKYDSNWVGRYQVQQVALKTVDVRPAVAYLGDALPDTRSDYDGIGLEQKSGAEYVTDRRLVNFVHRGQELGAADLFPVARSVGPLSCPRLLNGRQ